MPKHLDSSDSIRSDLKVVVQPSLPRRQGRNNAIPFCVFFVKKNVHHFAIFAKDSLIDRVKVGIKSDKAAPLVINFVKRCDKKNDHIFTSFLCNISDIYAIYYHLQSKENRLHLPRKYYFAIFKESHFIWTCISGYYK